VLRAAAERFGWVRDGSGVGQGIACGVEKGGRIATVAQVRDVEGARACFDSSPPTSVAPSSIPDTVINQIEGATVMALGGALFEAIRFREGVITNGSLAIIACRGSETSPPSSGPIGPARPGVGRCGRNTNDCVGASHRQRDF